MRTYYTFFFLGDRSCALQKISLTQIFLIFASIMKRFSFQTYNASPLPSSHPIKGGLTRKPADFFVDVRVREQV